MGIKKGTRLTDTPKDKSIKIRMDAETAGKLDAICEQTQKTKSQIVRDGINQQYAKMQEQ